MVTRIERYNSVHDNVSIIADKGPEPDNHFLDIS